MSEGWRAAAIDLGVEHMLPDVIAVAAKEDLWTPAMRLLVKLGPDLHRRLAPLAAQIPEPERAEALSHARELGVLDDLGVLGVALAEPAPPRKVGETRSPAP